MADRATSLRTGAFSEFIAALGPWGDLPGPLLRKLARAVANAIERGALPDGFRLPSERALADTLAIGRGTAVAAYDILVSEGLLERRRGSGTFVAVTDQPRLPEGREGSALIHRLVERSHPATELIDLSIAVLHEVSGLPDVAVGTDDLASVVPDTGYTPWGLPRMREAIAAHITEWGLPTTDNQVVITTGAQQAISAAAACWVRPGDTVVTEDPTYPGALAAFTQAGARVVGAPVDAHGVDVAALARHLASGPALLYLQPTLHNPTGVVLAAARRKAIAELVEASHVPVVEDLALADLAWKTAPPPLTAHLPRSSVVVVGSLSKLFWGGLRVGFARAPEPLALRFARIKATQDLGSSAVSQLLALRLLESAPSAVLARARASEMRERHDVLVAALRRRLPAWRWREPHGGVSLWIRIPTSNSESFAQRALRYGVAVATPAALSPSTAFSDHIRVSFSAAPAELEEGVDRLAAAWRSYTSEG